MMTLLAAATGASAGLVHVLLGPDHLVAVLPHAHVHAHAAGESHDPGSPETASPAGHAHRHGPWLIGALHGVAGGSHLVGVLPALALPAAGVAGYLGGYVLGSIGAMIGFGELASRAGRWTGRQGAAAYRAAVGFAGLGSIALGVVWCLAF